MRTPVLLGSWDHPSRGAEEGAPEQGKGWGKAKQGESIQPPSPSCGEAPRGRGDGRSPFFLSPRLANKQDSATALLPCELIERLSLERLVNENRSPCRIVSGGVLFSPLPATPFPSGADLAHHPQEPCAANRAPPTGPGRATLQGLRWLLRTVPAAPVPLPGPDPRASRGCPPARRWVRDSVRVCPLVSPPHGARPHPRAMFSPHQGPAAHQGGCPRRYGEDGGIPAAAAHPPPSPRGERGCPLNPGWDGMGKGGPDTFPSSPLSRPGGEH